MRTETGYSEKSPAHDRCVVCHAPGAACIGTRLLCLQHYEQDKLNAGHRDELHAMMVRLVADNPQWQRQASETRREYNHRMFANARPLAANAVKRMVVP